MNNLLNPFVSIIIPTYNDWHRLQICLDALKKQTISQESFQVIVVNNNPEDQMPIEIELADNVIVLNEAKSGSYAARNKGLEVSTGDLVGFTDSDTIPNEYWIENAIKFFQSNHDIKRVGGAVKLFYQSDRANSVEAYDSIFAFRQREYVKEFGFAVTANMFTYRSLFDEIGNFNAELLSGGDFEWGARAQAKGYPIVYLDSVLVMHPARNSYKELKTKIKRVSAGHLLMKSKMPSKWMLMVRLIKGFKPNIKDIRDIYQNKEVGMLDKLKVLRIRYYLGILSNLEKIKISFGNNPERL